MSELTTGKVQTKVYKRTDYKAKYFTARAYAIFVTCMLAGIVVYSYLRAH